MKNRAVTIVQKLHKVSVGNAHQKNCARWAAAGVTKKQKIASDTVATYTPIESKNRGRVIPVLSTCMHTASLVAGRSPTGIHVRVACTPGSM